MVLLGRLRTKMIIELKGGKASKAAYTTRSKVQPAYVENDTNSKTAYTSTVLSGALTGSLMSRLLRDLRSSELSNHIELRYSDESSRD